MQKRKEFEFAEDLAFLQADRDVMRNRRTDVRTKEKQKIIRKLIRTLPRRDRQIMTMYLGHFTCREIGIEFGISRQRVSQIIKRNIRRIKRRIQGGG